MIGHIEQAAYDSVHNSSIDPAVIAKRMGINRQVLINKVNPHCEANKLGLLEAVALQLITDDKAILRAMETELSDVSKTEGPKHYLMAVLHFNREVGDVVRAIEDAAEDGKFTCREIEQCMRELDQVEQSIKELRSSLIKQSGISQVHAAR